MTKTKINIQSLFKGLCSIATALVSHGSSVSVQTITACIKKNFIYINTVAGLCADFLLFTTNLVVLDKKLHIQTNFCVNYFVKAKLYRLNSDIILWKCT